MINRIPVDFHISEGSIMMRNMTAIIENEGSGYVALCPELDIASQGDTILDARENLKKHWNSSSKRPHPKRSRLDFVLKCLLQIWK
jgi:hypothetical protein